MTKRLLVFLLLSFSVSAHAAFTAICESTVTHGDRSTHELQEAPLKFEPIAGNEMRAKSVVQFSNLPDYTLEVTVHESYDANKVEWNTQTLIRRKSNGNVVSRGALAANLKVGNISAEVICSSFDKTEALTLPPGSANARETARGKYLDGLGPIREFVIPNDPTDPASGNRTLEYGGDIYDLYQQLLGPSTVDGEFFRQTVSRLKSRGFEANFRNQEHTYTQATAKIDRKDATCRLPDNSSVRCDIERVELAIDFLGPFVDYEKKRNFTAIEVYVEFVVRRRSDNRLILGYRVLSVRIVTPDGRGGTASTSGGR